MGILALLLTALACTWLGTPDPGCMNTATQTHSTPGPQFTGDSIDVVVSADSFIAWDVKTGAVLKEHLSAQKRPVASLSKLATVLLIQDLLKPSEAVEIPTQAARAQRLGANIKLPVGEHAYVKDLLAASLIPSANDAAVTLAVAAKGSEEEFVSYANVTLPKMGFKNTQVANATGLQGGEQYSTAQEVKELLMQVYRDPLLKEFMAQPKGVLTTVEGKKREYLTTNKLLGTYLPVLAAKTGYTTEAKENLALITQGPKGQEVGIVVLGSDSRFQDAKILAEWIWRNYSW